MDFNLILVRYAKSSWSNYLDNWTQIYQNSGKAIRFEYPKMFYGKDS